MKKAGNLHIWTNRKTKEGGGVWAEVTKAGWVRVMEGRLQEAGRRAVGGGRRGVEGWQ